MTCSMQHVSWLMFSSPLLRGGGLHRHVYFWHSNIVLSSRHSNCTLHKIHTGRKPDISHSQFLRCMVYTRISKKDRASKLNAQSMKCVLVRFFGWGDYKLFKYITGCIFCSQDVIFEEGQAHRTLLDGYDSLAVDIYDIFEPPTDLECRVETRQHQQCKPPGNLLWQGSQTNLQMPSCNDQLDWQQELASQQRQHLLTTCPTLRLKRKHTQACQEQCQLRLVRMRIPGFPRHTLRWW